MAQPKRLALLAYLAAARPAGFHSRDTLLALLWPDLNQEHARAALRQTVYMLRRELGADMVIGCGDSVLGVDPSTLWCDVNAFEQRIAAGDDTKALDLYRGELLEGFHVSGAVEFERWFDRERAWLARDAAAAAWRVADTEEKRGDQTRALNWARRLLALCPDDERALRHMVSLLSQAGDRGGAIRVYQEFTRHLDADYGLSPSPQTRALMASVRAEGSPGATHQPNLLSTSVSSGSRQPARP